MEDFLAARTRVSPDAPALVFAGRTWTYDRLNREVAGVCGRLADAGVRPGSRVGVLLGNLPLYVFIVHALVRLRAVIVPLNVRLKPPELADQVDVAIAVVDDISVRGIAQEQRRREIPGVR
jgi:O-succinylbenzoic acid--CoA ligase